MLIYLDSDGVIADFDGFMLNIEPDLHTFDDHRFCETMGSVPNLFKHLPLLEGSHKLVHAVKAKKENTVKFLTALPTHIVGHLHTAKEDKEHYLKGHFDLDVIVVRRSKLKVEHVQPGAVLVDDFHRNIERWNEAGGIGILHRSHEATLDALREIGAIHLGQ